jgi:hypothetical protein
MKNLWLWGMVVPGLILLGAMGYISHRDRQRQAALMMPKRLVAAPAPKRYPPTSKYTMITGRVLWDDGTPVEGYYINTSPRMAYYSKPEIEAWRAERSVAGKKELKRLKKLGLSYEKNFTETLRRMSGPYGHAFTDAKGRYRFTHLTESSFCVRLWEDPPGWTAPVVEVQTKYKTPVRAPDIVLTPGGIVRGRVYDITTKKPLPGVEISSYGPHRPIYAAAGTKSVTSDAQGRYAMRVMPGTSLFWISGGDKVATFSANFRSGGQPYGYSLRFLKYGNTIYSLNSDIDLTTKHPYPKAAIPVQCMVDGIRQTIIPDCTEWIEVETGKSKTHRLDFAFRSSPLLTAKQRASLKITGGSMDLHGGAAEQLVYEEQFFVSQ